MRRVGLWAVAQAVVALMAADLRGYGTGAPTAVGVVVAGSISGHISDENGRPVARATVSVLQSLSEPGIRRLASRASSHATAAGDFRVEGLMPGRYYVRAVPDRTSTDSANTLQSSAVSMPNRSLVPTFYPGTTVASFALPVVAVDGQETLNINFGLMSASQVHVAGTVIDSAGRPATDVVVMLNSRAEAVVGTDNHASVDPSGRFVLAQVAPGNYSLDVISNSRLSNVAETGTVSFRRNPADEFASVPITVSDVDVDSLVVQTSRGFQMSGRVIVEGGTPPKTFTTMAIEAYPLYLGPGPSALLQVSAGPVGDDGLFVLHGLADTRLVRIKGQPPGFTLKAIRFSGRDVTDDGLYVGQDISNIEVVLTAAPSTVRGRVTDARGTEVRQFAVAIFSVDSHRWTQPLNRWIVGALPTSEGQFEVKALPAGQYLAVALRALEPGLWTEPENLERLRGQATQFSVKDGEGTTLTLVLR